MARKQRLHPLVAPLVAVLVIMMAGTAGYVLLEGVSPLDAFYMTTITVTTIGFKEAFPLSMKGQLFTIMLAFLGVGVILVVATELASTLLSADIRRILGPSKEGRMSEKLKDHIVVCGYGRMGRAVVDALRDHGHPFVVVEISDEKCEQLADEELPYILGDATREDILRSARVQEARTFLACLADDALNVYSILLARQLTPEITIIARAVDEEAEERLALAGADRVINPYRLGGLRLAHTALKPSVIEFIETSLHGAGHDLEMAEVRVCADSEVAGNTLAEANVRQRYGVIVVALQRDGRSFFNPSSDHRIEAGDVLIGLGPISAIGALERGCR